jgi:hypothetical protein
MLTFLGAMTTVAGLFLLLWYRTVVALPVKRQPLFIHPVLFKWGVPIFGIAIFAAGLYLLSTISHGLAGAVFAASLILFVLVTRFDRYSAEMRIIHHHYRGVRETNPGLEEIEVLFLTAKWRYPQWSHDRVVELVAGKDIESLILLMLINENKINPITDWELYRSLRTKAARLVGEAKRG